MKQQQLQDTIQQWMVWDAQLPVMVSTEMTDTLSCHNFDEQDIQMSVAFQAVTANCALNENDKCRLTYSPRSDEHNLVQNANKNCFLQ